MKIDIQVLMADEVDGEIDKKKLSIINYQDSNEQGSHWVAFYNDGYVDNKFYFDPFALEPLPELN